MDVGRAEMIAKEQMTLWLTSDWKFRWSEAENEFGSCWEKKKEIVLSRPLTVLNDAEQVIDVILHEIAHALAGAAAGHGWRWMEKCRLVGARPERCYGEEVTTPKPRYAGVCAVHGVVSERRELGKQFLAKKVACGKCSPVYDARYALTWVDRRM